MENDCIKISFSFTYSVNICERGRGLDLEVKMLTGKGKDSEFASLEEAKAYFLKTLNERLPFWEEEISLEVAQIDLEEPVNRFMKSYRIVCASYTETAEKEWEAKTHFGIHFSKPVHFSPTDDLRFYSRGQISSCHTGSEVNHALHVFTQIMRESFARWQRIYRANKQHEYDEAKRIAESRLRTCEYYWSRWVKK